MPEKKDKQGIQTSAQAEKASRLGHRTRLKERLIRDGTYSLSDVEVLELLLAYAIPRRDVRPLAGQLLDKFGSLKGVLTASAVELTRIDGIRLHTAALLRLAGEIPGRFGELNLAPGQILKHPEHLERHLLARLSRLREESVLLIFLDTQSVVLGEELIGAGSVDQVVTFPRQIIEKALLYNASALIIAHNHPHGPPLPSSSDREEAEHLRTILRPFDIIVKDSIVVGQSRCFSIFRNSPL
ncbi:MAG: DNA repair protein RadC [Deltaproteobacteria bacterium]|nr:DNA repair protein RadC [Deltaproteobacteria bacterium]